MKLQVLKRSTDSADRAQMNLALLPESKGMQNGEGGGGGER